MSLSHYQQLLQVSPVHGVCISTRISPGSDRECTRCAFYFVRFFLKRQYGIHPSSSANRHIAETVSKGTFQFKDKGSGGYAVETVWGFLHSEQKIFYDERIGFYLLAYQLCSETFVFN